MLFQNIRISFSCIHLQKLILKSYLDFGLQFDVIDYSIGNVQIGFLANTPVDRR